MTMIRKHGDLTVAVDISDSGRIDGVKLYAPQINPERITLTPQQAYALTDDIAIADPDTWAKHDPKEEVAELALRRVADYFQARAKANRAIGIERGRTMADAFDLAVTRVMEEIEALYEEKT